MDQYGQPARRPRWATTVAVIGLVALLVVGAYLSGAATAPEEAMTRPTRRPEPPAETATPVPAEIATRPRPVEPSDDPELTAANWLRAYHSARFDDEEASEWIDRVQPVVTESLHEEYQRYRDGSVGADWHQFVQRECIRTVEDVAAVIPPEAPRTGTKVSVQVAGWVATRCLIDDNRPEPPREPVAATVELDKGADGTWRVSRRLH